MSSIPLQPEAERVDTDLRCAECGYNLRTLTFSASCPECGMSVRVSARGDRLASADPGWTHKLVRGGRWLRLSVAMALPIVYPGVPFSCYAVWRLTAAQPGRIEPASDRGARISARWATVIGGLWVSLMVLGALIAVATTEQRFFGDWNMKLSSVTGTAQGPSILDSLPAFDVMFLVGHAVYVLGLLSTWRYLRVLAQRVPDEDLANTWRRLGWVWLGVVVGLACFSGLVNLLIRMGIIPGGSVAVTVPVVVGLIFSAVMLWLWIMTFRAAGRQVLTFHGLERA